MKRRETVKFGLVALILAICIIASVTAAEFPGTVYGPYFVGAKWYNGDGVPGSGTGLNGDYYLRTANGDVYEKSSGVWSIIGNIIGPQGIQGETGPIGPIGPMNQTVGPEGPQGIQGETGPIGPTGPMNQTVGPEGPIGPTGPMNQTPGTPGSKWYAGNETPSDGLGINDDYYFKATSGDIYNKTEDSWHLLMNIIGPQGIQGETGPIGPTGSMNQTIGPEGAQGIQGDTGPMGLNGSKWWSGTIAPSDGLGDDNDYYLDIIAGNIYNKTAGTWGLLMNTLGLQGPQGDQGEQGIPGPMNQTPGEQGIQGEIGPVGPMNQTPGEQGPQGIPGPMNQTPGEQGIPGEQGPVGPTSPNAVFSGETSTANAIVIWNGTTGRWITDSGVPYTSLLTSLSPAVALASYLDTKNISAEALNNSVTQAAAVKTSTDLLLENASLKVAGGPPSNASAIAVFPSGAAGRAINSTNVTITGTGVNGPNILDMGLGQVRDMADPTASMDAATKGYVDSEDAVDVRVAEAYTDTNASKWLSVTTRKFAGSNSTTLWAGSALTFTLNSSTRLVTFELMGGGGGGGGSLGGSSTLGLGGGGGTGGYCKVTVTATPSSAVTFTVGVNGTAGLQTPGAGGNGVATTITYNAVTYTANAGTGGPTLSASATAGVVLGGAGSAISTNCDINGAGQPGNIGVRTSGTVGASGTGAGTTWGGGGIGKTSAAAGGDAIAFGAGGGGGWSGTTTGQKGGKGGMGIIYITEYAVV